MRRQPEAGPGNAALASGPRTMEAGLAGDGDGLKSSLEIMKRLGQDTIRQEGISIPLPRRDVHVLAEKATA